MLIERWQESHAIVSSRESGRRRSLSCGDDGGEILDEAVFPDEESEIAWKETMRRTVLVRGLIRD
nr:hypothetical protein BOH68_10000 [Cobetia sp. MM1IDA2H-1]